MLGLPEKHGLSAHEYLVHREYELSLDEVATHLYEFDIKIDEALYEDILKAANKIQLAPTEFSYLQMLLK